MTAKLRLIIDLSSVLSPHRLLVRPVTSATLLLPYCPALPSNLLYFVKLILVNKFWWWWRLCRKV